MKYFKSLLFLVALSAIISSCSLIGNKGGKPTAQNPGQLSTATGLQYTRDAAEGFPVNEYNSQPDAPNMVLIEGGRAQYWVPLKRM
jgi:sulfatase modifying factor 1